MSDFREWVGGKLTFPFLWEEQGRVFEPEVILWAEMPEKTLLGCHFVDPQNPRISFSESLMDAMHSPLIGPPRRPDRIRVDDSRLVTEIRPTLANIDLVSDQTPELYELLIEIGKRLLEDDLVFSS